MCYDFLCAYKNRMEKYVKYLCIFINVKKRRVLNCRLDMNVCGKICYACKSNQIHSYFFFSCGGTFANTYVQFMKLL